MRKVIVLLLAVAALAGCKTEPVKKSEPQLPAQSSDSTSNNSAPTSNVPNALDLSAEQQAKQALSSVGFVIYFDYDKSDIKSEYNAVLAAHAKYLSGNANAKVRLEGNTDERGSREYNIGLGERRAQAVRRALLLQGV